VVVNKLEGLTLEVAPLRKQQPVNAN